jgi:hypothetical protein
MTNQKAIKTAYQDILAVCEKYSNLNEIYHSFDFDDIKEMAEKAKNHLLVVEWQEKYGIDLGHDARLFNEEFMRINDHMSFCYFGDAAKDKAEHRGRSITWSDDGRQPKNEWLLVIGFPTGPYIFGEDYDEQRDLFQDFFDELKSYKPDFSDTHNHVLYWKLNNAKDIYKDFDKILQKYEDRNQDELKERRIAKLKKELEELENEQ